MEKEKKGVGGGGERDVKVDDFDFRFPVVCLFGCNGNGMCEATAAFFFPDSYLYDLLLPSFLHRDKGTRFVSHHLLDLKNWFSTPLVGLIVQSSSAQSWQCAFGSTASQVTLTSKTTVWTDGSVCCEMSNSSLPLPPSPCCRRQSDSLSALESVFEWASSYCDGKDSEEATRTRWRSSAGLKRRHTHNKRWSTRCASKGMMDRGRKRDAEMMMAMPHPSSVESCPLIAAFFSDPYHPVPVNYILGR